MAELFSSRWKRLFRRRLLGWFDQHARDLPWRRTRQLYHVWISEIMLQQTQVQTVIPYYERFIERFPSVLALAAAPQEEVLRCWEGLGYYRRARQLHEAAKIVVAKHDAQMPRDFDRLVALPGIGRYTAGAILSIALDARHPILEANTIRLLSRLLLLREDPSTTRAQQALWNAAKQLLPQRRIGHFNQALMELGSQICTVQKPPRCLECPVRPLCPTAAQALQHLIPVPKRKPAYERLEEAAVVVWRRGRVLMRRCAPEQRWAGLWDFPRFSLAQIAGPDVEQALTDCIGALTGLVVRIERELTTIRHGVTRFQITLRCYEARCTEGRKRGKQLHWVRLNELDDLPLNTTGRQISRLLQADHLRPKNPPHLLAEVPQSR